MSSSDSKTSARIDAHHALDCQLDDGMDAYAQWKAHGELDRHLDEEFGPLLPTACDSRWPGCGQIGVQIGFAGTVLAERFTRQCGAASYYPAIAKSR